MPEITTFLLNDRLNDQGWRITLEDIHRTAGAWINTPGILHYGCEGGVCGYIHTRGNTLQEAIQKSEDEAVSRIKSVHFKGDTLKAVHDITDPVLYEMLCNGDDIIATSASVWLDNPGQVDPIGSFTPVHVAWLSVPGAYGRAAEEIDKSCACQLQKGVI